MKKNVVWLYPKLEKWMGGTKFVLECCKLLNIRYNLIVICQKSKPEIKNEFKEKGIKIVDLNSKSFTDTIFWLSLNQILKEDYLKIKALIRDDTIIIHAMFPMNLIASRFTNKNIQIVYEPFAFFFDKNYLKSFGYFPYFFFRFMKLIYAQKDIKATKNSDVILTLSHFEKGNIEKVYGCDANVIYEGVDKNYFYPRDTTELKNKYKDYIPLMHSTGFDSFKGTDLVIKSLPLLKEKIGNFKLFITYTRENKKKLKEYRKFIQNNELGKNVEFLGLLPLEELTKIYSFAKIYIEPGIHRSMSLSNKEALACGTPVIRGNDSSEEIINGYNGILVDPKSTLALVDAITRILNDENEYTKLKANALFSIQEKFTWSKVVEKIIHHIED